MAPIARGRLNIVDFETKCSSLRLSGLSGYREGFGTCKWHFLARYFFGDRFSNLDPSFDFSSRSIPLSSEPSAFYRNCLSLLSSLRSKHGSLPADFSDFSCGTISAFFQVVSVATYPSVFQSA